MVLRLLTMLIRRALLVLFASTALGRWLGNDVTEYLLGDSVIIEIASGVITVGLLVWSAFEKFLTERSIAVARDASASTTRQEIKETVAAESAVSVGSAVILPSKAQIAAAFAPKES